jgi:hypothetical protein
MDFQYYPTPSVLVTKAWSLFKKPVVRLLEPSAGEGHLLAGIHQTEDQFIESLKRFNKDLDPVERDRMLYRWRSDRSRYVKTESAKVDVVEIDFDKHPLLREKGYNVVGHDFMQFQGASMYSHIIMNPPFAQGVDHVLKAWSILFDGELVAIINAESIKNPYTKERQLLCKLIEQYGAVEFIEGAFMSPDAENKTDVEVALLYLSKAGNFYGIDLLANMDEDQKSVDSLCVGHEDIQALAIPENEIENAVRVFNAAVTTMREAVFAKHRAARYARMLGSSLAAFNERNDADRPNDVREDVTKGYEDLKDRAWTRILRSSEVNKRLSQKGQKVLESQFETVKKMDFTISNIYGFLIGIINNQSTLNLEMALDVFDQVTYYHSDNAVWYKGWKSNDKHLTSARRMKTTRFILPRHYKGFGNSAQFETVRLLGDFDKVFAMMDGRDIVRKDEDNPFICLADLFNSPCQYERLCRGERLSSDYFDVRYYPGAGTIHFFPRSKTLVDRLNRLVGRHRQWLPQDGELVPDAFWLQYEMAEKFAKDVEAKIKDDRACHRMSASWERDELSRVRAIQLVNSAVDAVLSEKGIDPALAVSRGWNIDALGLPLPLLIA